MPSFPLSSVPLRAKHLPVAHLAQQVGILHKLIVQSSADAASTTQRRTGSYADTLLVRGVESQHHVDIFQESRPR
jgi:hypothetical protein